MKDFIQGNIVSKSSTGQFVFTQTIKEEDINEDGDKYEVDVKDFTEL